MDKDFLKNEMKKKENKTVEEIEQEKNPKQEPEVDSSIDDGTRPEPGPVDFRERYGTLRNQINKTRGTFKTQISEIKDIIEKRTEELELFKIKLHKLEGAVEASDLYLKEALPSNVQN